MGPQNVIMAGILAISLGGALLVQASRTLDEPPEGQESFRIPASARGTYDFKQGGHTLRLKQTVGKFFVGLMLEPKSLGGTPLLVVVRDAHNKPVTTAGVGVEAFMPEHPHMGVDQLTASHVRDGVYQTQPNFTMEGEWQLVVALRIKGEPEPVIAPFSVTLLHPPRAKASPAAAR